MSEQSDSSLRKATIRGLQSSGVIWSSFRSITRTLLLTVFTNEKHMAVTCNTARNTALWVCFWPQTFEIWTKQRDFSLMLDSVHSSSELKVWGMDKACIWKKSDLPTTMVMHYSWQPEKHVCQKGVGMVKDIYFPFN